MLLYILRHGDPDYEHDCLTEKGKKQAAALADRLAVHGLDQIYCSPLGRARETAAPTAAKLGLPVTVLDWLSESLAAKRFWVDYADGHGSWVYQQNGANLRVGDDAHFADWKNANGLESLDRDHCFDEISPASDAFLESLGYKREGNIYRIVKPSDERIGVFCHEGRTMTWMPYMLQIPPHVWWAHFAYSHTGITVIEFCNEASGITVPRVLCWSDLSHIYHDGDLPLTYNGYLPI